MSLHLYCPGNQNNIIDKFQLHGQVVRFFNKQNCNKLKTFMYYKILIRFFFKEWTKENVNDSYYTYVH